MINKRTVVQKIKPSEDMGELNYLINKLEHLYVIFSAWNSFSYFRLISYLKPFFK